MHYPNDGEGSLISSDSFDDFAEVELKIKQNREMVFVIGMPTAPLAGDQDFVVTVAIHVCPSGLHGRRWRPE